MGIREEIVRAFSKTPRPDDSELTSCPCEECRGVIHSFLGKRWSQLQTAGIEDSGSMGMLSPRGFQYFLPGLLLLWIDHPDDYPSMIDAIVARITFSDQTNVGRITISEEAKTRKRESVQKVIQQLGTRQRSVVADFLVSLESTHPHVPEVWKSAISNLRDGQARPYSQSTVDSWLAENYGPRFQSHWLAKSPIARSDGQADGDSEPPLTRKRR